MASDDDIETIKAMLHALENMLTQTDRLSALAGQLVESQKANRPLSPPTLNYYTEQLEILGQQRAHMRMVLDRWWALVEETH